jgi:hypothetical protein
MIHRCVVLVLLVLLSACAQTATPLESEAYTNRLYIATTGADTNTGTLYYPFRTIQKCAAMATPGTICLVRAGTYRETIKPSQSGTAALPILFKPYNNEKVLLSGADVVKNWSASSGSIYKAPVTWSLGAGNDQVFVDRKMMIEARYPNAGLELLEPWKGKFINPRGSGTSYTSDAVTVPTNIIGAKINILPGPEWVVETGTITAATASSFTFNSPGGQLAEPVDFDPNLYVPRNGNPYFIWGKRVLLDSANEWFLEGGQLYLQTPQRDNPTNHTVEVKRRLYAFDLTNRSYINIEGFQIFAATITTGDPQNPDSATSSNIILKNIHVRYPSHFTFVTPGTSWEKGIKDTGIILYGKNHQLLDSTVAFSAGNGVTLAGSNHKVSNTIIHDVAYAVTDSSAINAGWYGYSSKGHTLQYNTLYNTGRSVVVHRNTQALKILNNHLYNAGLLANDLGMTYSFQADGSGTVIAYNLVHDNFAPSESMGIYLDNGSRNYTVHHNIVWNVKTALNLNLPSLNNRIYNNTLIGWREAVSGGAARQSECDGTGTKLINNIFGAGLSFGYVFDGTACTTGTTTPVQQNNLAQEINPKFVDALTPNFALQAGSPAIDAGRILSGFTTGYTGSNPDIGALESGVASFKAGATITEPCVYGDTCAVKLNPRYGVSAEYFSDETLTTLTSKRNEGSFSFGYYGETDIPAGSFLPSGANYSARWTAYLRAPVTGTYTFTVTADDGARLWLNNVQRINRWEYKDPPADSFSVALQAGQYYSVKLEMRQGTGGSVAWLEWAYPGQPKAFIPTRYLTLNKP